MSHGFKIAILIMLFANLFIPSTVAIAEDSLSIDIPLATLNGDQSIDLTGLISTQSIVFPIPTNWKIDNQNWLDVDITASELLDLSRSSITIALNGKQVKSFQLDKVTGTTQRIELPAIFFKQGENTLSFSGTLYLLDDLATNCKGWDDPSRWLLVGPQSNLHISLQKQALSPNLSQVPEIFMQPLERYLPENEDQILFVVPDNILTDDLNALSATAYFLGHEGGEDFVLHPQVVTESQFNALQTINSNIVFIDTIPKQFKDEITAEKNAIAIFPSPWADGKVALVIFDQDREDGYSPAFVLGDQTRKVLLTGNVAYLDRSDPSKPPAFKNKYTFEELGYLDRTVRGIGKESLIYRIYIPYNVDPTSARLSLQLTHSPELDVKNSSFGVHLNGFTVASILPTSQSASLDPIQIDLPRNRFHPGINFVRFTFNQHLPYSSCEKAPDSVWTTIFNQSTFELTYKERDSMVTLKDFPMPFNAYPGFSFVVPNQPDSQTLNHVAQLAFSIGAASYYVNQPPDIITADKYISSEPSQGNYIYVGSPTENHAIKNVNDFLPQPFTEDMKQLQEGFGVFLPSSDQDASIGLLEIIPSPWVKHGTILVLTGTDSQGMDWAWDVILDPKIRDQFSGNLMVVGSDKRTVSLSAPANLQLDPNFQQTAVVINIPVVGKFLQKNGLAGTMAALIAIVAAGVVILVIIKIASIATRYEIRKKQQTQVLHEELD